MISNQSLEESDGLDDACAVDVSHQSGKSGTAVHEVLLNDGLSLVNVFLVGIFTFNEAYKEV